MLARRDQAIMATCTGTQHLEVVHALRRLPDTGAMAIPANIGRADMLQALAGRDDAVVATDTAPSGRGVIKVRRQPGRGSMANVTGFFTGNVVGIFTRRSQIVMATCTGTQHLEVIDLHHWCPVPYRVAILADIGGADMVQSQPGCLVAIMTTHAISGNSLMIE